MNLLIAFFELRVHGVAGPHVAATIVTLAACAYLARAKLHRSAPWKVILMLPFLVTFAFMLHELFFNPIVDLWNVFTDPAILIIGYEQLNYPSILLLMFAFEVGVWWYFFQGEFDLRAGSWWWLLWALYCCAWWIIGFHTSLPFWFQSSATWPWLHDPVAALCEFLYTSTFMWAFVHSWKTSPGKVIRGELPRFFR